MTPQIKIGYNISLNLVQLNRDYGGIHIDVYVGNERLQPVLRIDKARPQYTLFRWRDEGRLPDSIETVADPHDNENWRLIVDGVDEI